MKLYKKLRETEDMLMKKQDFLEKKIETEVASAQGKMPRQIKESSSAGPQEEEEI